MEHIRIMFFFLVILTGAVCSYYVFQKSRTENFKPLRYLFYYLFFLNLVVFSDLISRYVCENLLQGCPLYYTSGYFLLLGPINSFFFLLMTYYLLLLAGNLQGVKKRVHPNKWFWPALTVLIPTYIARTFFYQNNLLFELMVYMHLLLPISAVVLHYLISFYLLRNKSPQSRNLGNKVLSSILVGNLTFLILGIFLPEPFRLILVTIVLFMMNILPVVWVRKFAGSYLPNKNGFKLKVDSLTKFHEKYNISKREQDIAELIINGKSNKEIEASLYISSHTVKNHIYKIYQKLGVKSRGQMINLFLEENANN